MGEFPYSFNSPISGNEVLDAALAANFRQATADNVVETSTVSNIPPIGTIIAYGKSTAPTGWLLCDGAAISRTDYADLFAVIGTTFGTGDGSTTFNVPDIRGRVPVGAGTAGTGGGASGTGKPTGGTALTARALAHWTGAETVALASANLPAHSHTVSIQSGTESADHSHSGSTGGITANHTHTYGLIPHHDNRPINTTAGTTYALGFWSGSASTGTVSSDHGHNFTTGGRSAAHSHLVSGNTGNGPGSATAHSNVQPQLALTFIIKASNVGTTGVADAVDTNDPRLSNSRTPTGAAGGELGGTYPNPIVADGVIDNANVKADAGIALSKLAQDPLARSLHTGTQLASTISDFNAAVLAAQSRVAIQRAGVAVGTRKTINFIEGDSYIDIATADNAGSDRVDVTLTLSPEGLNEIGSPQLDGGVPGSLYGGVTLIDAGGV